MCAQCIIRYVPPVESLSFDPAFFSAIQEKVKSADERTRVMIFSDMNPRFSEINRNLPRRTGNMVVNLYNYPRLPDPVFHPIDNAVIVAIICSEECLEVRNNLETPTKHFPSKLM